MNEFIAVSSVASTLLVIGLMAYFALRPERAGPKCPRCDKSLKPGTTACPRCHLTLGRGSG